MSTQKLKALELIEHGFHLIPLHHPGRDGQCSCGNDCGSSGKHPRVSGWPERASRDPDQIKDWWSRWPDANIGIACGRSSDLVVLDVDPRHGGEQSLDALEERLGCFTQTTTIMTGGGGKHFYFRYPGEGLLSNSNGKLGDGLDIKTDGGYVVAPGSLHQSGAYYEWLIDLEQIQPFPKSVIRFLQNLQKTPSTGSDISTDHSSVDPIPEGKRNDTLFRMGVNLREEGMTYRQIYNELLDINGKRCTPTLGKAEVDQIAKSASKPPATDHLQPPASDEEEYGLWDTDFGNARELAERCGDKIRYDIDGEQWLFWDGVRWKTDSTGLHVMGMAKELVEDLYDEAVDGNDQEKQKHARRSATEARLKNMMSLSTTFPGIKVSKDRLDQCPMLVTLDNVTVDLSAGKLLKPNPKHLITKKLPFSFDSDAECPRWEAFVRQIMDGDQAMIRFLQQAVGYTLTGMTTEQCLFFLYGSGRNGKSTFVEILMQLMGEYAIKSESNMIMDRSYGGSVSNDVARLCSHRLVVLSEIQEGKRLDEAKVKNLTGEDTISARFLRKEFFDFTPTHKLWVFGNHKPLINGTDDGIWRRLRLIKFGVTIPKNQVDRNLKAKLIKELPGIFNWAVRGCRQWIKNGQKIQVPDSVRCDTMAYRSEMDILSAFLEEACQQEYNYSCSNQDLRRRYEQWCDQNGIPPMSMRAMSPKLEQRGLQKFKSNGRVHWRGIALKHQSGE
ncbi:MAG TPA: phage/plasmid primase, P4 family [Balneolaceae bacterium]|nr:phage/plasmid primase, P4 family [Balneolaceae bacterium]